MFLLELREYESYPDTVDMITTGEIIEIHQTLNPREGLAILSSPEVAAVTAPDVSAESLDEFADIDHPFVQALVAANTTTSPETLAKLARLRHPVVAREVIKNANTLPETLTELVSYTQWHPTLSMVLANNPRTPWDVLYVLMNREDQNPFIKFSAMANPNVPAAILTQWAGEGSVVSRRAVAVNRNTPSDVLAALYESGAGGDTLTIDGIASNPNTPAHVLVTIAAKALTEASAEGTSDEELTLARRAAVQAFVNPAFPHHVVPVPMGDKYRTIRINMVRGESLPDAVWYQLANDPTLHEAMVHVESLPQGVLNVMLQSSNSRVRNVAAMHPSLTPEFVNALLYGEDPFTRAGAVVQRSSHLDGAYSVSSRWAAAAAKDASAIVRKGVASREDLPVEVYLELAQDPDHDVRYQALATLDSIQGWSSVPDDMVIALACDPNADVRMIAKSYFLSEHAVGRLQGE